MDRLEAKPNAPLAPDGLPVRCDECIAYVGNTQTGVCHCPPVAVAVGVQNMGAGPQPVLRSYYAAVDANDWCILPILFEQALARDRELEEPAPQPNAAPGNA